MKTNRLIHLIILLLLFIFMNLIASDTKQVHNSIKIDTSKTGEPIEKYIYGQFIEHLGKCIYGGIWAEMLEDRKFYYPCFGKFKN